CFAVGRPLRITVPEVVPGQAVDPCCRLAVWFLVELCHPHLSGRVAGVSLALVRPNDEYIVADLLGRARIDAVVGDKGDPFAVRRKDNSPVEAVVEDSTIGLLWSG